MSRILLKSKKNRYALQYALYKLRNKNDSLFKAINKNIRCS